MPKLDPKGTKTSQLEFTKMRLFAGFCRTELVGVGTGVALITRRSPATPIESRATQIAHKPYAIG